MREWRFRLRHFQPLNWKEADYEPFALVVLYSGKRTLDTHAR
jgi:hypothetical protein